MRNIDKIGESEWLCDMQSTSHMRDMSLGLGSINADVKAVAGRARDGSLLPDDVEVRGWRGCLLSRSKITTLLAHQNIETVLLIIFSPFVCKATSHLR